MTSTIPALMAPAVRLLDRMNFRKIFLLMGVIITVPLVFLTGVVYLDRAESVTQAEREQLGIEYITAIRPMIENVARTRGMTSMYLEGKTGVQNQIMAMRDKVDQSFAHLAKLEKTLPGKTDSLSVQALWADWNNTNATALAGPVASVFENYTAIVEEFIALMERTARQTGLYSNASDFYTVDSLALRLPDLAEAISRMRDQGAGMLAAGKASADQRVTLNVTAARVTSNLYRLRTNFDEIFATNTAMQVQLKPTFATMNEAINEYLKKTRMNVAGANELTGDASRYFSDGTSSIDHVFKLYDQLAPALHSQRQAHIAQARFEELELVGLALLIIGTLAYLFAGFFVATRYALDQLGGAIEHFSDGDLTVQPNSTSRDELGTITNQTALMIEKMNALVSQVVSASTQISSTAEQSSVTMNQSNGGIQQQIQEIDQVATAIEEMSATVQEVARNAAAAAEAADEVRTLASRTQQSTEEIHTMIDRLQQGARNAVTAMESGQSKSEYSVSRSGEAREALGAIESAVTEINDMNAQIASAAEEQSAVAEEINRNVITIRDISTESAAGIQQTAESSRSFYRLRVSCSLWLTSSRFNQPLRKAPVTNTYSSPGHAITIAVRSSR